MTCALGGNCIHTKRQFRMGSSKTATVEPDSRFCGTWTAGVGPTKAGTARRMLARFGVILHKK